MQMLQRRRQIISEKAAACASSLFTRSKHEVVDDQLLAAFEQVCQFDLAFRAFEDVFFGDSDHGEFS